MSYEPDPMLSDDPAVRDAYAKKINNLMEQIQKDDAAQTQREREAEKMRRAGVPVIGQQGFSGGATGAL